MLNNPDKPRSKVPSDLLVIATLNSIYEVLAAILVEIKRMNAERGVDPGAGGRGEE